MAAIDWKETTQSCCRLSRSAPTVLHWTRRKDRGFYRRDRVPHALATKAPKAIANEGPSLGRAANISR